MHRTILIREGIGFDPQCRSSNGVCQMEEKLLSVFSSNKMVYLNFERSWKKMCQEHH